MNVTGVRLWVDDMREPPEEGYTWVKDVNGAKKRIERWEELYALTGSPTLVIELIDVDHDAGFYAHFGGDYIKLLDWLEETGRNYPIRIHSMNPVGVQNMRAIIERNGWTEVF